jgi:nitrogen fixation protein FixH
VKVVIAIVAAVVLGAVAVTIWVASQSYERTVVPDPYQAGIEHDADRRHAEALGWGMTVDESALRAGPETALAVRLTGKGGAPLEGAEVKVRVSRPGTSRLDRMSVAHADGPGRYVATLPMPEAGFWDLDVMIRKGPDTLALGRWIHVGGAVGEGVHCDAGERACAAESGGVRVVLDLSPRPPAPLKELRATVQLQRGGAPLPGAEVSVELAMPGMYMGENRIRLRADGDGYYAGTGALVRCASGRRDWTAEVVARLPGGAEARARFPFQAAE